jgi:hypothetical protein
MPMYAIPAWIDVLLFALLIITGTYHSGDQTGKPVVFKLNQACTVGKGRRV